MGDELEPAYLKNNIVVVFECSEMFVPYLSVALSSLVETVTDAYNYDVIILNCEIKRQDEVKLKNICQDKNNISIRFFDPTSIVENDIEKAVHNYLYLNYYRLALPWILLNYEKIVNLGVDIIIEEDISKLYTISLDENYYIAGALDLGYQGRLGIDIPLSELKLTNPFQYINADVLVLDLKKIRENYSKNEIMCEWEKNYFRYAEQDALNVIFDGHIQKIDSRWNVFPDKTDTVRQIEKSPKDSIRLWRECLKQPYIIHYAGVPKPWEDALIGFGDKWWKYARQSIYYEEIVRRMCVYGIPDRRGIMRRLLETICPPSTKRRVITDKIFAYKSIGWKFGKCIQNFFEGTNEKIYGVQDTERK